MYFEPLPNSVKNCPFGICIILWISYIIYIIETQEVLCPDEEERVKQLEQQVADLLTEYVNREDYEPTTEVARKYLKAKKRT